MTEAKVERRVALLHEVACLTRDLERFLMMRQGLVALTEVIGSVRRGSQGADQPGRSPRTRTSSATSNALRKASAS